jgi:uncharacterized protein YjbI with pentapeptide repeats
MWRGNRSPISDNDNNNQHSLGHGLDPGSSFNNDLPEIEHPEVRPGAHLEGANLQNFYLYQRDIREAHLEGAHLEGAILTYANLTGAHLEGAFLQRANLRGAHLEEAYLQGVHLEGADLTGADLRRTDFTGVDLTGVIMGEEERQQIEYSRQMRQFRQRQSRTPLSFQHITPPMQRVPMQYPASARPSVSASAFASDSARPSAHLGRNLAPNPIINNLPEIEHPEVVPRANLQRAQLEGAHLFRRDIREAHLEEAHLERADLQYANLTGAHLEGAHLEGADLRGAHLTRAHLEGAHLEGADLRGANLNHADLRDAHLNGAHLEEADLGGADLIRTHLEVAFLQRAHLYGACLIGTHLEGADLRGVDLGAVTFLEEAHLEGTILNHYQREQVAASIVRRQQNNARRQQFRNNERRRIASVRENSERISSAMREYLQNRPWYSLPMHHQPSISASANQLASARPSVSASARPSVSASAFAGHSALTISRNDFNTVINIPRVLRLGAKNSDSNSCPSYKPLYDQLMLVNLDGRFRFHYEGESGRGRGLTKIVYSFVLPVYTKLYFVKVPATEFIILKKDTNIEELNRHTQQMIKLAKAAQSQIYLQIDPRLLELLLPQNAAETIARSNNFNSLYANLKAKIAEVQGWGINMSNYLLKNDQNQNLPIQSFGNINKLTKQIQAEIILRKKLHDFGFQTWLQYQNMASFIKIFWIASNRRNESPLFSCEIKYDIESFMERLQIKRVDNQQVLNIQEAQSLYGVYPALGPLLDYILDQSENGNENRRKLVKYVAGTEYTLDRILILLQTVEIPFEMSNKAKIYRLPFLAHTCSASLDLFRNPSVKNYQEVWTAARIDEEITKGSSLSAHN